MANVALAVGGLCVGSSVEPVRAGVVCVRRKGDLIRFANACGPIISWHSWEINKGYGYLFVCLLFPHGEWNFVDVIVLGNQFEHFIQFSHPLKPTDQINLKSMKKLYLDIDGVLLTSKQTRVADFADQFIDFVVENFDCYWLTTHCKGDSATAISYLSRYFSQDVIQKLLSVKPTNWTTLKTEAIEFNADYLWLDDNPFQSEIAILKANSHEEKLIKIDLNRADELERIKNSLAEFHLKSKE